LRPQGTSSAESRILQTSTAESSMQPPEEAIDALVAEWVRKAELDFQTVVRLVAEDNFRDIVVFHAQQAAEKYLKALLTNASWNFRRRTKFAACLNC